MPAGNDAIDAVGFRVEGDVAELLSRLVVVYGDDLAVADDCSDVDYGGVHGYFSVVRRWYSFMM